jgi:hypothetical protein
MQTRHSTRRIMGHDSSWYGMRSMRSMRGDFSMRSMRSMRGDFSMRCMRSMRGDFSMRCMRSMRGDFAMRCMRSMRCMRGDLCSVVGVTVTVTVTVTEYLWGSSVGCCVEADSVTVTDTGRDVDGWSGTVSVPSRGFCDLATSCLETDVWLEFLHDQSIHHPCTVSEGPWLRKIIPLTHRKHRSQSQSRSMYFTSIK